MFPENKFALNTSLKIITHLSLPLANSRSPPANLLPPFLGLQHIFLPSLGPNASHFPVAPLRSTAKLPKTFPHDIKPPGIVPASAHSRPSHIPCMHPLERAARPVLRDLLSQAIMASDDSNAMFMAYWSHQIACKRRREAAGLHIIEGAVGIRNTDELTTSFFFLL